MCAPPTVSSHRSCGRRAPDTSNVDQLAMCVDCPSLGHTDVTDGSGIVDAIPARQLDIAVL
jgi:hypothetical protein